MIQNTIKTREELRRVIRLEKEAYFPTAKKDKIQTVLLHEHQYAIFRYVRILRKSEYHYNNRQNPFHMICYILYERRKNRMGQRLGLFIGNNAAEAGFKIFHYGTVIVNSGARIGKNCKLHGNNCIGNNGKDKECPIIGDNVDIGFGAQVIGKVRVADNVVIGSGAVVVKDCLTPGAVLVGVPAKEVQREKHHEE